MQNLIALVGGFGIIALAALVIPLIKFKFARRDKKLECEYGKSENFGIGGADFAYHIAEVSRSAGNNSSS